MGLSTTFRRLHRRLSTSFPALWTVCGRTGWTLSPSAVSGGEVLAVMLGDVHELDAITRSLLLAIATAIVQARRARGWSQHRLARKSGLSQSLVSLIERCGVPELPVPTAVRVLRALDIEFDLRLVPPLAFDRPRDAAHARCIAYVARRLERYGFIVATEVGIGGQGWTGAIDVLAYHPIAHVLLVVEVKTEIHDLGALERQIRRYERASWAAARSLGWRPRAATGILLLLATDENDRRLAAGRAWFERVFSLHRREVLAFLEDPERPPARERRGLAMIDPRSRRVRWLLPTWIDGRRTPAPYPNRGAYLRAAS
jgi:transcriptional regulator with XRE-family HTH domain